MANQPDIIDIEELLEGYQPGSEAVVFVSGKSSKERQAKLRESYRAKGLKSVTGWVPENEAASVMMLMRRLMDNPDLVLREDVPIFRNVRNGQFVGL